MLLGRIYVHLGGMSEFPLGGSLFPASLLLRNPSKESLRIPLPLKATSILSSLSFPSPVCASSILAMAGGMSLLAWSCNTRVDCSS